MQDDELRPIPLSPEDLAELRSPQYLARLQQMAESGRRAEQAVWQILKEDRTPHIYGERIDVETHRNEGRYPISFIWRDERYYVAQMNAPWNRDPGFFNTPGALSERWEYDVYASLPGRKGHIVFQLSRDPVHHIWMLDTMWEDPN